VPLFPFAFASSLALRVAALVWFLAMTLLLSSVGLGAVAWAEARYENPPVLKASELAPPTMLKGPLFTVDERVPIVELLGHFTIRSDYGVFEAHGRDMLGIRVVEVGALAELDKTSKTDVFLKAAGAAAARPVNAAVNMAMHPVETAKGAPAAVGRFFDRVKLGARHVTSATEGDGSAADKTAAVTKRVGSVTADVLGYEEERRALAKRLGVDPYTTNQVLSEKMNEVAWVAFSGRFGLNLVISVAVPFSMAISATSVTNNLVWDMKPGDLLNLDQQKLKSMGFGEHQIATLMQNPLYSVTSLTALVDALESLKGVRGRDQVAAFAGAAAREDKARLIVAAVNMLAHYHAKVAPLAQVDAPGPLIARTRAGAILVPAPLDYVPWTQAVATFARRPDLKAKKRTAWLTGRLSARAKKEFAAAGWTIHEEPIPAR
jgi:hypothetical protein